MKINIIRGILIVLLLGTFFIIFQFSSQDGEKSSGLSTKVTKIFLKQKEADSNYETIKKTEKIIRKTAHFLIYTVVGFLGMALLHTYEINENKKFFISLDIGVLYAISDEIHQLFVPGRSAQVTDVMIDTMGVTLGIILLVILMEVLKRIKNRIIYKERNK